ncbi:MAG: transposase, partial [Oscillospiraceae bacterium]
LLKRIKTLSAEDRQAVGVILKISPKLSMAHYLKELFFELLQEQDPKTAKKLLAEWIMTAQEYDLPQFISCTKTFATWSLGICNSFEYRYSNGFTEGCNNKIKVLKRNAYGYRNFKRFRNRILHIFSDKNTPNQALKTAVA